MSAARKRILFLLVVAALSLWYYFPRHRVVLVVEVQDCKAGWNEAFSSFGALPDRFVHVVMVQWAACGGYTQRPANRVTTMRMPASIRDTWATRAFILSHIKCPPGATVIFMKGDGHTQQHIASTFSDPVHLTKRYSASGADVAALVGSSLNIDYSEANVARMVASAVPPGSCRSVDAFSPEQAAVTVLSSDHLLSSPPAPRSGWAPLLLRSAVVCASPDTGIAAPQPQLPDIHAATEALARWCDRQGGRVWALEAPPTGLSLYCRYGRVCPSPPPTPPARRRDCALWRPDELGTRATALSRATALGLARDASAPYLFIAVRSAASRGYMRAAASETWIAEGKATLDGQWAAKFFVCARRADTALREEANREGDLVLLDCDGGSERQRIYDWIGQHAPFPMVASVPDSAYVSVERLVEGLNLHGGTTDVLIGFDDDCRSDNVALSRDFALLLSEVAAGGDTVGSLIARYAGHTEGGRQVPVAQRGCPVGDNAIAFDVADLRHAHRYQHDAAARC